MANIRYSLRMPIAVCILALPLAIFAQNTPDAGAGYSNNYYTPKHKTELGISAGHSFLSGDLDYAPSFGVGISLRRALDYMFSIRGELNYQAPTGDNNPKDSRQFSSTVISGSIQGIITLNNLKWDKPFRKVNPYAFAGAGVYNFTTDYTRLDNSKGTIDNNNVLGLDAGAGIAFRVNSKFNIGLEHKATMIFGNNADLLDGFNNPGNTVTTYRDILNYTSLRLNFNLGGADKVEPLYWLNPLDVVLNDVSELKARPKLDLTDTDGDGVIDMMDQEPSTPAGAAVNVRGVALDSDADGIADYKDAEPFSPPGITVNEKGVAQTPKYTTEGQVNTMIENALKKYDLSDSGSSMADWFLPIVHFDVDSYKVRYADYGNLANVANVLKSNPKVKVLVSGHTDKTASDNYNEKLSYNRAQAAIDMLVTTYGISRDRLVLNYGGESTNLVPSKGNSFMNRRVEFRVATSNDKEMSAPNDMKVGKGGSFKGNKAGY